MGPFSNHHLLRKHHQLCRVNDYLYWKSCRQRDRVQNTRERYRFMNNAKFYHSPFYFFYFFASVNRQYNVKWELFLLYYPLGNIIYPSLCWTWLLFGSRGILFLLLLIDSLSLSFFVLLLALMRPFALFCVGNDACQKHYFTSLPPFIPTTIDGSLSLSFVPQSNHHKSLEVFGWNPFLAHSILFHFWV